MSIAKDILIDEYNRLNNLLQEYKNMLDNLPKGSLSKKKIKNHIYFYLAYRIKSKVKFDYIGKKYSERYIEIVNQLSERKKLMNKIRQVKQYIKELKRYVK